jgi:hypothetical protein
VTWPAGTPVRLTQPFRWSIDQTTGLDVMAPLPAGTGGYVVEGEAPLGHAQVFLGWCHGRCFHAVPLDDLEVDQEELSYMAQHPGERPA